MCKTLLFVDSDLLKTFENISMKLYVFRTVFSQIPRVLRRCKKTPTFSPTSADMRSFPFFVDISAEITPFLRI